VWRPSSGEEFATFAEPEPGKSFVFNARVYGIASADPGGMPSLTAKQLNHITRAIIGAAIRVHKALGPGLLESVYLASLVFELSKGGFSVETQKAVPVSYQGVRLDCGFRGRHHRERVYCRRGQVDQSAGADSRGADAHVSPAVGCTVGLILNFNVPLLKQGIKRVVCGFPEDPEDPVTV
jgi:PD-(D/E)XK nuclease superfamily